ncbi:Coiled-coil domain containing 132 [Seminavis robusta]|uniref:Coiled-coil domain containing 132 n=1 Tax=Seminavis robusta TaxID=568900 RepID=A0A9N8HDX0_9STRA|nr:Coiled-coil domain containing 132 [Seminavis robusta]|eukprot:Sro483_g152030.1 Coiled-coil domain containing 132 (1969) ;mRNA; r:18531-24673
MTTRASPSRTGTSGGAAQEMVDTAAIAWTEPTNPRAQKARRVKVWLKHSIHSLASPSAVDFQDHEDGNTSRSGFRDPARRPLDRRRSSSSNASVISTTTNQKTTATIDQAMFSLYSYVGPKKTNSSAIVVPPEAPSSYVPGRDYDWLLDGIEEWETDEKTSQEYLEYLNQPWDMEGYLGNYLSEREETHQQQMQEEEKSFQFEANFDMNEDAFATPTIKNGNHQEDAADDDAAAPSAAEQLNSPDSDDFGDFQQAIVATPSFNDEKSNNIFATPHPGGGLSEATESKVDGNVEDEGGPQQIVQEESIQPKEEGDDQERAKEVQKIESEEEEKSQEEFMVEEAVQILKSLPTDEFNRTFDTANGAKERNQVLLETCNLATKLEQEVTEKELAQTAQEPTNTDAEAAELTQVDKTVQVGNVDEEAMAPTNVEPQADGEDAVLGSCIQSVADSSLSSDTENNSKTLERIEVLPEEERNQHKTSARYIDLARGEDSQKDVTSLEESSVCDDFVDTDRLDEPPEITQDTPVQPNNESVAQMDVPSAVCMSERDEDEESFGDFCAAGETGDQHAPVSTGACHVLPNRGEREGFAESPVNVAVAQDEQEEPATIRNECSRGARPRLTAAASSPSKPTQSASGDSSGPKLAPLASLQVDCAVQEQHETARALTETQQNQPPKQVVLTHPVLESSFFSEDDSEHVEDDERASLDLEWAESAAQQDLRISLRLPISDLSTPVARFARRQRQNYKQALRNRNPPLSTSSLFSVLEKVDIDDDDDVEPQVSLADLDLPHYYFTAEFDDTTRVIQSAPWHHIKHIWDHQRAENALQVSSAYSFEDQQDRQALWEGYITQELCHLDAAQNEVAKLLLRHIQPHESSLQRANHSIHQFSSNLHIAQMYLTRSQAYVRQAARGSYDHEVEHFVEGSGWFGAQNLLEAWAERDLYTALDTTLATIQDTLKIEKGLVEKISTFTFKTERPHEYASIIRQVLQLQKDVLSNEAISKILALNDLRCRLADNELLQSFRNRLHALADSVAVRACRRRTFGLSTEYKNLLSAALDVHLLLGEEDGKDNRDRADEEHKSNTPASLAPAKSWPQTMLEALCYEADRVFAAALLDPLTSADEPDGSSSTDSEFERELTQLAYEIQQDWGDAAKLRTITHNLVIIRFDWEKTSAYLLPVYHRVCHNLADVLYAHHMIGQWHERLIKKLDVSTVSSSRDEGKEEKNDTAQHDNPQDQKICDLGADEIDNTCDQKERSVDSIRLAWMQTRETLWKRCEGVLIQCLEEYLQFASHESFFKDPTSGELKWRLHLEEMHNLLKLTEQFSSLRSRFHTDSHAMSSPCDIDGDLKEKLCDVFRKHLRFVHVEAMNALGSSLSQENWEMVALKQLSEFEKSSKLAQSEARPVLPTLLIGAILDSSREINESITPTRCAKTCRRSLFAGDQQKSAAANPFLVVGDKEPPLSEPARQDESEPSTRIPHGDTEVYKMINEFLSSGGEEASSFTRLASKSLAKVFFTRIARLLVIMGKLPLVTEDVSVVFANLCDLYFTTVFRICVGSASTERIILGLDRPSLIELNQQPHLPMSSPGKSDKPPSSPPLFGFRRRSSSSSLSGRRRNSMQSIELPATLEADLCAPLFCDSSSLTSTRAFIERAQLTLRDIVLLDKVDQWITDPVTVTPSSNNNGSSSEEEDDRFVVKAISNLEKRMGAAWSCLGIAALLDATCVVARKKLCESRSGRAHCSDLSTLEHYKEAALKTVSKLIQLASKVSTMRAIMARRVVSEVIQVGPGWEECKLNEHPNEYIESLASRCACIWAALSISPNKLPDGVRKSIWEHMIEGGYVCLLDGFARIPYCSTEGRAQMNMDLASFSAGIQPSAVMERLEYQVEYPAPPKPNLTSRNRVDTFIKVFYYPKKDVMAWIIENHEHYSLNHCLSLVTNAYRGSENGGKDGASMEEAVELVKKMFEDEPRDKTDEDLY